MTFQVTCPGCGAVLTVSEDSVGRRGKCVKCGQRMLIESPSSEPRKDQPTEGASKDHKRKRSTRPASERQKAFAADLGIDFDEDISARDIGKLIDAALAYEEAIDAGQIEPRLRTLRKCEPRDMIGEMEKRNLAAVMFYWDFTAPTAQEDYAITVSFTDNITENKVYSMLVEQVMRLAIKHETADLGVLLERLRGG